MKARMYIAFVILAIISFFVYKPFKSTPTEGNPIAISGTVVDEENQPIPKATIYLQGTTHKVYTDRNGEYDIEGTEYGRLAISHSKYRTQDIAIEGRHKIDIALLKPDSTFNALIEDAKSKLQ